MSKAALRAFDRLLASKRRRIERTEAEAAQSRQVLQQCEDAHRQAAQQEQACRDEESACRTKLDELPARKDGFRPADVVTLGHILETRVGHTQKAARETTLAGQRVEQAQKAVAEVLQRLRRAEQQLEQLTERRTDMVRRFDQADEDAQDEEAEETSVARLVAAQAEEAFEPG
jgi:hypothetical protein